MLNEAELQALVAGCLSTAARDICVLFGRTVAQYEHKVALLERTIAEQQRLGEHEDEPLSCKTHDLQKLLDPVEIVKEEPQITAMRLKTEDDRDQDQLSQSPVDTGRAEGEVWGQLTAGGVQGQLTAGGVPGQLTVGCVPGQLTVGGVPGQLTVGGVPDQQTTGVGSVGQRQMKRHRCPECQKGFVRPSDLERHMSVHSGLRPYDCSLCGRSFSQKINLKRHMKTHSAEPGPPPERKHACSRCGKRFTRNSELNRHQRSHTGLRPFTCATCGKSFMQRSHLKQHLTTHSNTHAFSCALCGRSFSQSVYLQRHLRLHTQEEEQLREGELEEEQLTEGELEEEQLRAQLDCVVETTL